MTLLVAYRYYNIDERITTKIVHQPNLRVELNE
jgi:hypothetical protein